MNKIDYSVILEKLGVKAPTEKLFEILLSVLNRLMESFSAKRLLDFKSLSIDLLNPLLLLTEEEKRFVEEHLVYGTLSIEECQVSIQKEMVPDERKERAAFFTNDNGLNLMGEFIKQSIAHSKRSDFIISDPFMGTARTLVKSIEVIGRENILKVVAIEEYYLSALVGFAALLMALKGEYHKIDLVVGNAFEVILKRFSSLKEQDPYRVDYIITNPPFTRWEGLEKDKRDLLLKFCKTFGYHEILSRKSMGLQIYSLFLCDVMLKKGGILLSVLPLSTFYTNGGKSIKILIKKKYTLLAIIDSIKDASFSIDSGFKEIILVSKKSKNVYKQLSLFSNSSSKAQELAKVIFSPHPYKPSGSVSGNLGFFYDIEELPKFIDNNWWVLLNNHPLQRFLLKFLIKKLKEGTLSYLDNVISERRIIRGFEIYGPHFFFLPNKFWKIREEREDAIIIENDTIHELLRIEKQFVKRTLSKPGYYYKTFIPKRIEFVLDVPPIACENLSKDLQKYIHWGIKSQTAKPAINAFDGLWYSHIHNTLVKKNPQGFLFIGDKIDLKFKTRAIIANFSPYRLYASKNFYIFRDLSREDSKLMAAWFNSSLFLAILILLSRKISNTWTRFLRDDYLNLPMININTISQERKKAIRSTFSNLLKIENLPYLWNQLGRKERYNLDLEIFKALGTEDPHRLLKELYSLLLSYKDHYLK